MATSPDNVIDFSERLATREAIVAAKALMSALVALSHEIKRLEKVVARYGL